jgi:hypothetical protein
MPNLTTGLKDFMKQEPRGFSSPGAMAKAGQRPGDPNYISNVNARVAAARAMLGMWRTPFTAKTLSSDLLIWADSV